MSDRKGGNIFYKMRRWLAFQICPEVKSAYESGHNWETFLEDFGRRPSWQQNLWYGLISDFPYNKLGKLFNRKIKRQLVKAVF